MTYMMTMVSRGRGKGIVVATGVRTEVGKTSKVLDQDTGSKRTNLQKKLAILGRHVLPFFLSFYRFSPPLYLGRHVLPFSLSFLSLLPSPLLFFARFFCALSNLALLSF
jgi:magnesium-transporting ATPase (P-type)